MLFLPGSTPTQACFSPVHCKQYLAHNLDSSRGQVSLNLWEYPIPGSGGGIHLRSGQRAPHPRSRWGLPHPADGGYSIQDQDRGNPHQDWMRVPPCAGLDGVPPIRKQISIVSTCYAAGSVPLALTQEDFLVVLCFGVIHPSVFCYCQRFSSLCHYIKTVKKISGYGLKQVNQYDHYNFITTMLNFRMKIAAVSLHHRRLVRV